MELSKFTDASPTMDTAEQSPGGGHPMLISSTDGLSQSPNRSIAPAKERELQRAILCSVAYSDIFDYPLTSQEIHRYLAGVRADRMSIDSVLSNGALIPHALSRIDDYVTLPGREHLIDIRRERASRARERWIDAKRYGRMIARLPFVRMVAVTGELAVNNVQNRSDIDYFVVTEPGRLWLTRAMVILIVKLAARRGIVVCPNYLVTENALSVDSRNLYTAREMAQMIPLSGIDIYERLRERNPWVLGYLPNADGPPERVEIPNHSRRSQRLSESLLRTPVGDRLETWEMNRKIEKFTREMSAASEVAFSADWCKGHFDEHGKQTLDAYAQRLRVVEGLLR